MGVTGVGAGVGCTYTGTCCEIAGSVEVVFTSGITVVFLSTMLLFWSTTTGPASFIKTASPLPLAALAPPQPVKNSVAANTKAVNPAFTKLFFCLLKNIISIFLPTEI
jgi:hypothetical protein